MLKNSVPTATKAIPMVTKIHNHANKGNFMSLKRFCIMPKKTIYNKQRTFGDQSSLITPKIAEPIVTVLPT